MVVGGYARAYLGAGGRICSVELVPGNLFCHIKTLVRGRQWQGAPARSGIVILLFFVHAACRQQAPKMDVSAIDFCGKNH